jgi:hypothetical protein
MGHAHCRPGRHRSVQSAYRLRFCRDRAEILNHASNYADAFSPKLDKISIEGNVARRPLSDFSTDYALGVY